MAIVKRGDRYQVKVRGLQGEWWTQTVGTRRDAEHVQREMETALARGEPWIHPRARLPERLTLRTAAETFIDAQSTRLARRTLRRYGSELEQFVTWAESKAKPCVSDLSRPLLRDYLEHVRRSRVWGGDRKPATSAKHLKTVMVFWVWVDDSANDYGWVVPRARRIELPPIGAPVAVAPNWSEMDDMLSALDDSRRFRTPWAWRAAMIQRFTGGRIGEVLTLRWVDVDLERHTLQFRSETTKGGYGGREVPLSRHLVAELRKWERWDDYIVGEAASKLIDTSRPARVMSTAWRSAGVREGAWKGQPTHALRKGVISGLIKGGANRDAVEVLVGHSLGDVRGAYIDRRIALDLVAAVDLIPAVGVEE